MANKKLEKTIVYQIEGVALFEDRRYYKTASDRFLFIEKTYLREFDKTIKYISNLKPKSLIDDNASHFIYVIELKPLMSASDYNNLLCKMLKISNEYDKINIVFPYLIENKDFSTESINRIIEYSLKSKTVRNAFQAQNLMLELIYINKSIIDSTLFNRVLSDFPHKSGGIGWVEMNKI
jgi:hypothetical protein